MAVVLDLLNRDPRPNAGNPKAVAPEARPAEPRHPEKQKRPENPILRKPDWIRVKAPGSPKWAQTKEIVKDGRWTPQELAERIPADVGFDRLPMLDYMDMMKKRAAEAEAAKG